MDPAELLKAIAFAADKHRHQRRRDAEASPYNNHPIAVANVLAGYASGMRKKLVLRIERQQDDLPNAALFR